ncbi:MAG: lysylphosphatidylglycerol synthase transmembrane domain-containing protein [Pyrinomonadaceae bacterium]
MQKYIKFLLLFLFAVFIFWFFGRNLDWNEVAGSLRQANPFYIALAVAIICLGYLLRAMRWKVLLKPITETSLKELFATTTVGFAAVFFVGRAGEIVRPMWLPMRDKRVRPSAALVTLGVERIFDLAALICFFSVNLIWFDAPAGKEREFGYVKLLGNVMLACAAVSFACLYIYQKYSPQLIKWAEKITDKKFIPRRVRRLFISLLNQLAASLKILKNWREIVSVVFWTIMLWLSIAVPTWLVILAFDLPVTISLGGAMFIMFWAAMGSLIPTPGGAAGAFHAVTAGGLIFLNVPAKDAAAVSIVMHLVYFAPALLFGFYYLFHGDISVAQFRSLLSSEHAVEEIEEGETESEKLKVKSEKRKAKKAEIS